MHVTSRMYCVYFSLARLRLLFLSTLTFGRTLLCERVLLQSSATRRSTHNNVGGLGAGDRAPQQAAGVGRRHQGGFPPSRSASGDRLRKRQRHALGRLGLRLGHGLADGAHQREAAREEGVAQKEEGRLLRIGGLAHSLERSHSHTHSQAHNVNIRLFHYRYSCFYLIKTIYVEEVQY